MVERDTGNEAPSSGDRGGVGRPKRRRWRRWVAAFLVLGVVVLLSLARLVPCWPTYRMPELSRAACLASRVGEVALNTEHPRVGLAALNWGWRLGARSSGAVPGAVAASLRAGRTDDAARWLERARALQLSAEELDGDLRAFGVEAAPLYQAWRAAAPTSTAVGTGLEPGSVEAAGFDPKALEALLARAKETDSSALVLVKDGAIAGEWYFDGATQRTETMSATKAITGLAIGLLVADGTIPSVDTPISHFFPEWSQGLKAKVTLRHVLTHTSGLEARRDVLDFIWRDDFVKAARDSNVLVEPGTVSFYNNKAMNLLGGVVKVASGKPLDSLLDERLFRPLGIEQWDWLHDPSGNPHAMSGLRVHPLDLAKVGVMLADGGLWHGRRVLPAEWIAAATQVSVAAAPDWGFLFKLHPRKSERTLGEAEVAKLRSERVDPAVVAKLAPLVGERMDSDEWVARARRLVNDDEAFVAMSRKGLFPKPVRSSEVVGFSAIGSFGIHLTVFPSQRLVAVRMALGMSEDEALPEFPSLVRRLLPALDFAVPPLGPPG
jgi:CubicO group peptidase (beta-lactamase class C family)